MVVGNSILMAALGVGDSRTLWPQRHAYASVKRHLSFGSGFTPSHLVSLCPAFSAHNFPQVFPFHHLVTINHDFCLHLAVLLRCVEPLPSIITPAPIIFNNGGVVGRALAGTAALWARYPGERLVIHGDYRWLGISLTSATLSMEATSGKERGYGISIRVFHLRCQKPPSLIPYIVSGRIT